MFAQCLGSFLWLCEYSSDPFRDFGLSSHSQTLNKATWAVSIKLAVGCFAERVLRVTSTFTKESDGKADRSETVLRGWRIIPM
jgi:hypothetical protein